MKYHLPYNRKNGKIISLPIDYLERSVIWPNFVSVFAQTKLNPQLIDGLRTGVFNSIHRKIEREI